MPSVLKFLHDFFFFLSVFFIHEEICELNLRKKKKTEMLSRSMDGYSWKISATMGTLGNNEYHAKIRMPPDSKVVPNFGSMQSQYFKKALRHCERGRGEAAAASTSQRRFLWYGEVSQKGPPFHTNQTFARASDLQRMQPQSVHFKSPRQKWGLVGSDLPAYHQYVD